MWSQKPHEAVSDVINLKIFLGEHKLRFPPSDEKSRIKRCLSEWESRAVILSLIPQHADRFIIPAATTVIE